jgi:tRNA-specific 2-thiouridylase
LLPVGEYEKHEVRAIAEELKLPVFNKPDSQEICFVPNQDYAALIRRRSPEAFREGQFVTTTGEAIGTHSGHQQFTIGQRKGLGIARGHRLYVLDINPADNRVTLGEKVELERTSLVARQVNLLDVRLHLQQAQEGRSAAGNSGDGIPCQAKIRYNHEPQPARVTVTGPDEFVVRFDEPQGAVTPGQAVVLYDGDVVLGGGWIEKENAER